jgi:glucose/arabinose dehydrogenase
MKEHSVVLAVACAAILAAAVGVSCIPVITSSDETGSVRQGVFTDYRGQSPGRVHMISKDDLPAPYATRSAVNPPRLIERPEGALPQAPSGFRVDLYASRLENPRIIRTAPNGDLFVAESAPGRIRLFRGVSPEGNPQQVTVFASGLHQPFGIAFYPPGLDPEYVYIANTDSVIRFPYKNGDLQARGPLQVIVPDIPGGGRLQGGGHWTRDVAFSPDGKQMYISVGSRSNVDDTDENPREYHRADILAASPDGSGLHIYAWGIRNAVGIAVHPQTGELWASVNERDGLGDNVPPDYITHIQEGGFYGWPWYYTGGNQDPRHRGKHPELRDTVIVPDVLIQPHNASLEMAFCRGSQFPEEYRGDIFAAQHGSWNKAVRTGYEVIRVPLKAGRASGTYQDFLTGFATEDGEVWGRPVGVAFGLDGSLFVTDDGSNSIWLVRYAVR